MENDNEEIELNKGDYIYIPHKLKHRVTYTSTNPVCVWLAIHFI
jgi:cupin 2 domain-containing protein